MRKSAFLHKRATWFSALALGALIAGQIAMGGSAEAAEKRNESRWFLQNVCLANTTKILGRNEWSDYAAEARASRSRLRQRGVPEAHLREMEDFAVNIINSTTTEENAANGPNLCIQWYST